MERPVFIVGCPRSGTTLLREILNRHPSLGICDETRFHELVYLRRGAFGDLADEQNRRRLIAEYLSCRPMQQAEYASPRFAGTLLRESTGYRELFSGILRYYADQHGKARCGEKTPQHALFLDTLLEWFPEARLLHLVRDPRACVASMQRAPWAMRRSVVTNARRWVRLNQAAYRFRAHAGYLRVRYEALASDPAAEVRRICGFLQEDYAPALLTGDQRPSKRARGAINARAIDAWREQLTAMEVAQIEWAAGSALETFGYVRGTPRASAAKIIRGIAFAAFDSGRILMPRLPALWYRLAAPTRLASFEYWAGPKSWRKSASG